MATRTDWTETLRSALLGNSLNLVRLPRDQEGERVREFARAITIDDLLRPIPVHEFEKRSAWMVTMGKSVKRGDVVEINGDSCLVDSVESDAVVAFLRVWVELGVSHTGPASRAA